MAAIGPGIDHDRAERRFIGVGDAELREAEHAAQFVSRLPGPAALRAGIYDLGGDEGIFDILPAVPGHLRMGAFLRDLGGADHPGVVGQRAGLGAEKGRLLFGQRPGAGGVEQRICGVGCGGEADAERGERKAGEVFHGGEIGGA